jgi:serine/threonine-protein kinase
VRTLALSLFAAGSFATAIFSVLAFQTSATRFPLPAGQQFTNAGRQVISISPDGKQIVYVANNQLFLKNMAERDARPISGTNGPVTNPVFSPDGKFVVFWSGTDQTLKRIAVTGGTPETLCNAVNPFGMSWGSDDQIVFGQGPAGIARVRASGGPPETLVTMKAGELAAHGPQLLPGGDTLLYTVAAAPVTPSLWDNAKIVAYSLKSNQTKVLVEGGTDARYAPTGHIVYANAGKILSVPFDATRLEVTGTPTTLVQGVRNAGTTTGTTQFSFSNNGTLIYLTAAAGVVSDFQLAYVDFSGNVKPIRNIQAGAFGPRISPDGKRVAYRAASSVWIADLTSDAPPRRLATTEPGEAPVWSPDGERIVFISIYNNAEALFLRRSDGTGTAELLADRARAPESWSAVHGAVSYITLVGPSGDAGDYDIWTYSFNDKKASPHIVIPPSAQSGSRFSPDGKWMAYESNETGRAEVYVEPYPRTGQRFQITKNGGSRPVWAPDLSRLFFDDNNGNPARMFSVNIRTQPTFTSSEPQALPVTAFIQPRGTYRRQWDITPDGRQFVVMFEQAPIPPQIEIVSNWFDQLRRR